MEYRHSQAVRRQALRAMEQAHAEWMRTPKWSPVHFYVKDRKERAMSVWDRACRKAEG